MTTRPTTLADLARDGELDGLAPHHVALDAEIADAYPCDRCGGRCTYRGFKGHGTYLAFQVCSACGHAEPF